MAVSSLEFSAAKYDKTNNLVVSLRSADGREMRTHNPIILGAETEWVPTVVQYPEGYDPKFHGLMQADSMEFAYNAEQNVVEVRFPNADFSPASIRKALKAMAKDAAGFALAPTDWYVIRSAETGKPIPQDVKAERDRIRQKADSYDSQIGTLPDTGLSDFVITYGNEPGQPPTPPVIPKGADGREWVTDATHPSQEGNPVKPVDEVE